MRFAAILIGLIIWNSAQAEQPLRQIIVQGEGRISATPDMAIISLGVTREGRTASAAMDAASFATSQVLDAIKAAGVAPKDVQTSSVNLSPRWDHKKNGPPIVTGYVASNSLSVRVQEIDKLGIFLDTVIGTGANTMNGLTFTVADPRPLQDLARADAVRDARAKADLLAASAGVTLGPVREISEGHSAQPPSPMMRSTAMEHSLAVPIAAGEVDFRVSVTVIFEIGGQ